MQDQDNSGKQNAKFLGEIKREDSLIALVRKAASLPDELMDTPKKLKTRDIARRHIEMYDFGEIAYFKGTPNGIEDIDCPPDEGELPDMDWLEQPTPYDN